MKETLKKIARFFGFTETETRVILLLFGVLIIGLIASHFKNSLEYGNYKEYKYEQEDSIFNSIDSDSISPNSALKNVEKYIDSQKKLLDFRGYNSVKREENKLLVGSNSVNINIATAEELSSLPGIGLVTAGKIIEFRKLNGPFKKVDDLLLVKGIGKAKLEAIRKFVFVE